MNELSRGLASRLHVGAQLGVIHQGHRVADLSLGEARPGVPMQPDTVTHWMSSGKPFMAVALAQLEERGLLDFDDPVCRHLPEFAQQGKEHIRIRHLLTHTAGLRAADKISDRLGWEETIQRICAIAPEADWPVGQRAGYHRSSSWFVLGEIVCRLAGQSLARYFQEHLFAPMGLCDCWLGIPADQARHYGARLGWMFVTHRPEPTPHNGLNSESAVAAVRPGGNLRGPIRELAKFYQHLLALWRGGRVDGTPVLQASTVRRLTARQRTGMFDETMQAVLDWGFGFLLQSPVHREANGPYGYGVHASMSTFGHGGAQSSCAFADPERDLAVAWLCNGMPGEAKHQQRTAAINAAIYEDLGLERRE